MSHGLGSSEGALGDRPDNAVLAGSVEVKETDAVYPAVSVIITTYSRDRWEWLRECIESAQAQTVPALEIIVVVDHNPELLEEIAREFPAVVAVPNIGGRGVSGARNSGVKASRGEVVGFIDDDAVLTPDWLATLLRHIGQTGVGGGRRYSRGLWEAPRPAWFPGEFGWTIGVTYSGMPS